jgi:predicted DNA-binding protein (UPF0251 family)
MSKTNNQTTATVPTNETQTKLVSLMCDRNALIVDIINEKKKTDKRDFWDIKCLDSLESLLQVTNAEIMQTLSEIACYKTLKFLMSNNATNGTNTETTENGTINTYGYNMALKLFNNLYNDIKIMHNPDISTDILTDSADLIQESNKALTPYFNNLVVFDLADIIYTRQLKNGNIKEYNAFQLACKSIRSYITEQDKKQYKKLGYSLGFTDNGQEVITTKKPKNDISNIEQEQKQSFISKYNLTNIEQLAILEKLNGLNTTETADKMQVSKRTIERALKSAKEKILKADKRIKL